MRPSFSPTHVTVDGDSGRPRFDDADDLGGDDDLLARFTARLSPSPPQKDRMQQSQDVNSKVFIVQGALQAVLCGGIIAVVLCPCMIGFATIIYSHAAFALVMPKLTKLMFLSSVVHQLIISYLSPLPFAIGQVQDAGLIFLSTMATSIMTELGDAVPLDERVATVVVHLSISTALIGLGLILTGKARLASLVQYLPTPVIGGYLAYIGFFMIKGGVSLMTGLPITGFSSWTQVFSTQYVVLALPGVACGVLLSVATTRYRHFGVFPGCLVLIPLVFFVALALTHTSLSEARDSGFLTEEGPMISLASVYELFAFEKVHWRVMFPMQLPTLLSMFVMLAFASSLDIASICMGTSSNMDYNEQLQTVGASNLLSGFAGGYTGSYIFSQTIFSYRFHPTAHEAAHPGLSRLIGLSLALCELGIALTPFALTTVVPKFLFGSVMVFIGIELLRTWLIGVYHKLLIPEYATVLGTFGFLNAFGVQMGLALGVAMAALCFLVEYATSQVVRIVDKSSNVVRNAEQHELLYSHQVHEHKATSAKTLKQRAIVTVELQGHIFFGSATRIQSCVKRAVYVWQSNSTASTKNPATIHTGPPSRSSNSCEEERLPLLASAKLSSRYGDENFQRRLVNLLDGGDDDGHCRHLQPTRFVVFDFSRVSGLDATAARSCFLALKLLFSHHRITAVYCGMSAAVEFLLRANDVLPVQEELERSTSDCSHHVTSDLDLALDWCEQQLILTAARKRSFESGLQLCGSPFESRTLSLRQIFLAYLTEERRRVVISQSNAMMEDLESYFDIREWNEDDCIFETDEPSDAWYVLLRGQVTLCTRNQTASVETVTIDSPHSRSRIMSRLSTVVLSIASNSRSNSLTHQPQHGRRELVSRVRAGCIFGDLDYVLSQLHVLEATSSAPDTVVAAISRERMTEMRETRLDLACLAQEVLLRASCMTMAEKLHSIVV